MPANIITKLIQMQSYKNLDIRDIDGEQWKPIYNLLGYEISTRGRVKLLRPFNGSYIKMLSIKLGYNYVSVSLNNKCKHYRICRLVAIHFIPNPDNKPHVNHKNGNKQDDSIENLEWSTASENMYHAYKQGLKLPTRKIA